MELRTGDPVTVLPARPVNARLSFQEGRGGRADDSPAGIRRVHLPAAHAGLPDHRSAPRTEAQPCWPTAAQQQPTLQPG